MNLTGADVFWLAALALAGAEGDTAAAETRLRRALDDPKDRFALDLSTLHLEGADLTHAHLEGADLREAFLKGASIGGAHLEGASLSEAHLEGADLTHAHLEGADLTRANLEGAYLIAAHLEGKSYPAGDAELERIRRWASDFPARLAPTDLRNAFLDNTTVLMDAVVMDAKHGGISVADTHWGGVNLAVIPDWAPFTEQQVLLGDERVAWEWQPKRFIESEYERKKPRNERAAARARHDTEQARARLQAFQAAVRANRQLATALRGQGMNEEADHFAYRAQVVQRAVFRQQGKRGKQFFSAFLDFIAGYGYKPLRSVAVYLVVIAVFAAGYWLVGPAAGHAFAPDGALVFSVTSFHGRGFFPGGLELENWITRLAALEAVLGLIIEISFIATFTQRFFGR